MTAAVATQLREPFVIAYSGEAVQPRLSFVRKPSSGLRLVYNDPRRSDEVVYGGQRRGDEAHRVLRARTLNNRRGEPRWRKLNTTRQWLCMEKLWCQVCGEEATDPETGRIPWITTATAFREIPGEPHSGLSSAPPTCAACIPESLNACPRLHLSSAVWTVASSKPVAVLADMYRPSLTGKSAVATGERSIFVRLDDRDELRYALAVQLVVRIEDMQPAPHLASQPLAS